jgi:hypothetical protein
MEEAPSLVRDLAGIFPASRPERKAATAPGRIDGNWRKDCRRDEAQQEANYFVERHRRIRSDAEKASLPEDWRFEQRIFEITTAACRSDASQGGKPLISSGNGPASERRSRNPLRIG